MGKLRSRKTRKPPMAIFAACRCHVYHGLFFDHTERGSLGTPLLAVLCSLELRRLPRTLASFVASLSPAFWLSSGPCPLASLVTVYSCRTTILPIRGLAISGPSEAPCCCKTRNPSSLSLSSG